jgi:hypothetical protein
MIGIDTLNNYCASRGQDMLSPPSGVAEFHRAALTGGVVVRDVGRRN